MDRDIIFEGLSALVGVNIRPKSAAPPALLRSFSACQAHPDVLSVQDLLSAVWFDTDFWQDVNCKRTGLRSTPVSRTDLFVMEDDFFDSRFDCDFTNVRDKCTRYMRGNEVYFRPYGWMRFALKVLDKYDDGNAWLGSPGHRTQSDRCEWPVSYHGTSLDGAKGIISTHYKPGSGQVYGRGVYSTPDVNVAESHGYTKTFVSKKNGKTYKVCMQNRINPKVREITANQEYWLVPVPACTSTSQERDIVMGAIRPYNLLLKEA
ncbi:uncharacterized protein LOC143099673 [Alosa pseudoharengus]|uniref:uncharacterized protein LOC143099673 n=1 Tax=Alosa pseudoharengus TaxID=34774 RepID=UPI003F8B2AC7